MRLDFLKYKLFCEEIAKGLDKGCPKGLNSAQLLMQDALKHELINPDYKNEYCAVKWYDDMNQGLSEFVGR